MGALVCEKCHTLLHSEDLLRISTKARSLEEQNGLSAARAEWMKALPLLPHSSTQAEWVRRQIYKLEVTEKNVPPPPKNAWAKWLGPLAPITILLAKGKTLIFALFKLKFLLSLGAFMALYWTMFGAKFGIGFVALILIHEMGHYIDIRRRGLPAEMPFFLPGLGAYVQWNSLGVTRETRAAVSLAGPCAGFVAAIACLLLWWKTGNNLWAALARAGAWLNLLNLIPVWVLDGGRAVSAMDKVDRIILLISCFALWFWSRESVFFLVAVGIVWRLFTHDLPPQASRQTTAYFVVVMAGLAAVMWLVPGNGFRAQ